MYFHLPSWALLVLLVVIVGGTITLGIVAGRSLRTRAGGGHEPVGVVQGALLGLVGLLLAFGLTMAVGRYEARRALVVQEGEHDRHRLPPGAAARGVAAEHLAPALR